MPDINLTNFSPSGSDAELRTLVFGPTGPMRLMLDIAVSEHDEDDFTIDLTVSNAAEHHELKTYLMDVIELLQTIVDDPGFDDLVEDALGDITDDYDEEED